MSNQKDFDKSSQFVNSWMKFRDKWGTFYPKTKSIDIFLHPPGEKQGEIK